jgi:hypothetical protein
VYANAEKYAQRTGATLLLTEWGSTEDTAYLSKIGRPSGRNMVGWQEWHYCPCDDFRPEEVRAPSPSANFRTMASS